MRQVKVYWEDTTSKNGWVDVAGADYDCISPVTIGFLVKSDKKKVTIAQTFVPETGDFGNVIAFPRRAIKKVVKL